MMTDKYTSYKSNTSLICIPVGAPYVTRFIILKEFLYLFRSHAFANDFGDIDEPFYDALINMRECFSMELRSSPARQEMYAQFRSRLLNMRRSSDIGWGYGDVIQETVDDVEAALGE